MFTGGTLEGKADSSTCVPKLGWSICGDHGSESNISAVPWVPAAATQGTVCPPTWS